MTSRKAAADRFNAAGRRVESVDVSVNAHSDMVYLSIRGEKRDQQFRLDDSSWLEIARLQMGEKRYAACWAHMGDAVHQFRGLNAHMREVNDESARCWCANKANILFIEVKGKLDQPEYPKGSASR